MKLFAGIAAIILIFAGVLQAQVMTPDDGYSRNIYTFHNHTYPDTLLRNTSYIIQELSVGNKVSQSESSYDIEYELFTRMETVTGNLSIGILLHPIHEPVTYKDFDIRNLLDPSGIRLKVLHLKNDRIILSYKKYISDLKKYDTTWVQLSDSLLKHTNGIKLENADFYYSNPKLEKVVDRIQEINDYYASKLIIDSVRTMAEDMPLGSPEHFSTNLIFLFELRKINERIKSKDFESSLGIQYHDPARLKEALRMLELLENRVHTLTDQSAHSKEGITKEEIEEAFDYYIELQQKYIKWATGSEHSYQESFYNLLVKSYSEHDLVFYENYLSGFNADNLVPFAYKCFYSKNLEFAEQCIRDQLYLNALGVLSSLDNLSFLTPEYADISGIGMYSSRAKHGLFESYMRVAKRAIQVRNFDLAREYLSRANNYQRANSSSIISDIDIKKGHQQLADAYMSSAAADIGEGKFENALKLLQFASQIQKADSGIHLNIAEYDTLLHKAQGGIFQKYLATASAYFNAGDFADARVYLNKAGEYNKKNAYIPGGTSAIINLPAYESYLSEAKNRMQEGGHEEALLILQKLKNENSPLINEEEIDTLIKQSAGLLLARLFSDIESLVFNKKTAEVQSLVVVADSIVNYYGIEDPALRNDLLTTRKSVQKMICSNYLDKYNELLGAGTEMIQQRKFIAAENYLLKAAELYNDLNECGINDTMADYLFNHYRKAADYERQMNDIRGRLYNEGFSYIIEDYLQLENGYYEENLRGLNVKHTTFVDFLLNQKNADLIIKSFRYFYEKKHCTKSLKMLDLLKELNVDRKSTKQMQREVAELCFEKQVDISASYTSKKNKWYQYFRKRLSSLQKQEKVKQIFKSEID